MSAAHGHLSVLADLSTTLSRIESELGSVRVSTLHQDPSTARSSTRDRTWFDPTTGITSRPVIDDLEMPSKPHSTVSASVAKQSLFTDVPYADSSYNLPHAIYAAQPTARYTALESGKTIVENQITSAEGQGPFEPAAETIQPYHYPTVTHTDPYNGGRVNPYNQYTRPCDSGEPCQSWGMRGNADGLLSAKNGGLETLMGSASSPGREDAGRLPSTTGSGGAQDGEASEVGHWIATQALVEEKKLGTGAAWSGRLTAVPALQLAPPGHATLGHSEHKTPWGTVTKELHPLKVASSTFVVIVIVLVAAVVVSWGFVAVKFSRGSAQAKAKREAEAEAERIRPKREPPQKVQVLASSVYIGMTSNQNPNPRKHDEDLKEEAVVAAALRSKARRGSAGLQESAAALRALRAEHAASVAETNAAMHQMGSSEPATEAAIRPNATYSAYVDLWNTVELQPQKQHGLFDHQQGRPFEPHKSAKSSHTHTRAWDIAHGILPGAAHTHHQT